MHSLVSILGINKDPHRLQLTVAIKQVTTMSEHRSSALMDYPIPRKSKNHESRLQITQPIQSILG